MAEIQFKDARKLLRIIASARKVNETLTYSSVSVKMGRPPNHFRAMAATCNLLDAAACLAGVPLLALITVLGQSGDINPAAFGELDELQRQQILRRSQDHHFVDSDYTAISKSLEDLGDKGAVRAWKFIERLYPGQLLYLRLIGNYVDEQLNAIDDLGADKPDQSLSEVWTYSRDPQVREAVLRRANGQCEFCGKFSFLKPNGLRYLESHHVISLANDGEDRLTNVIALCPNDHREAHFGVNQNELEAKMIEKLKILNS